MQAQFKKTANSPIRSLSSTQEALSLTLPDGQHALALKLCVDAREPSVVDGDGTAERLESDEVVLKEADDEGEDPLEDLEQAQDREGQIISQTLLCSDFFETSPPLG